MSVFTSAHENIKMIKLLIMALTSLFLLHTATCTTCEPEVAYSWVSDSGSFVDGFPMAAILGDDKFVIASSVKKEEPGVHKMLIRILNLAGESVKNCTAEVNVSAMQMVTERLDSAGESKVVVTWLESHDNVPNGILVAHVVDVETCTFYERRIVVHNSTATENYFDGDKNLLKYNNPKYFILSGDNSTAELFIWSSVLCGNAVCRISLPGSEQIITSARTIMEGEGPNAWKVLLVDSNNSSKGFLLLSRKSDEDPFLIIRKFDRNGTVVQKVESELIFHNVELSNGYGNILICASLRSTWQTNCQLFDSSLNSKLVVDNFGEYNDFLRSVDITSDGGFIISQEMCMKLIYLPLLSHVCNPWITLRCPKRRDEERTLICQDQHISTIKVQPDGTFGNRYYLFDSNKSGYLSHVDSTSVNESKDMNCFTRVHRWDFDKHDIEAKCLKMSSLLTCNKVYKSN